MWWARASEECCDSGGKALSWNLENREDGKMVTVTEGKNARFYIDFAWEKDPHIRSFRLGLEEVDVYKRQQQGCAPPAGRGDG